MRILAVVLILASSLSLAKVGPSFRGRTLNGKKAALKNYLDPKKGTLVCFWASWCSPCIEEMRKLSVEMAKNPDTPLNIITINVDSSETFAEVKPTVKALGLKFPVFVDKQQKIFSKYQSEQTLPYSVLLGPDRKILQEFNGLHDDMMDVMKKHLDSIGTEKKAPQNDKKAS